MQQQKEMLEAALNTVSIGYEGANKYKVRDPAGRPIYFVVEDSGCCSRQCCNPNHSMTLQVTDMTGERVMTMIRRASSRFVFLLTHATLDQNPVLYWSSQHSVIRTRTG